MINVNPADRVALLHASLDEGVPGCKHLANFIAFGRPITNASVCGLCPADGFRCSYCARKHREGEAERLCDGCEAAPGTTLVDMVTAPRLVDVSYPDGRWGPMFGPVLVSRAVALCAPCRIEYDRRIAGLIGRN